MRATRRQQVSAEVQDDAPETHVSAAAGETIAEKGAEGRARGKTDFVYGMVTDRILALIEQGTVPWRQPWVKQQNVASGIQYRGINQMLLGFSGKTTPYWMTFKQMSEFGGNLKEEDSKSTIVVFWKFFDKRDLNKSSGSASAGSNDQVTIIGRDDQGQEGGNAGAGRKRPPLLMYYRVFNADQIDFGDFSRVPSRIRSRLQESTDASRGIVGGDAVLAEIMDKCPSKPNISHEDAHGAYYVLGKDYINVPPAGSFPDLALYYGILFHELGHWTGPRLKRDMVGYEQHKRGDTYSREELVAEMTAAFASNEAGILSSTEKQSAAYLESWKRFIASDPKAIVVAAGKAQAAFDYLMGRSYLDRPNGLEAGEHTVSEAPF